jgi:hypothetical protein
MKLEKTIMFKKTLLAASIASMSAGSFAAANLVDATDQGNTTTAPVVSFEGAASDTTVAAATVYVQLGAEYSTGDVITLTFSGGELDTANSAPAVVYADDTADTGTADDTVTIGLLGSTASTVTFRVTAVADNAGGNGITTDGGELAISGLVFTPSSVLASATNSVTATYKATIAGDSSTTIDTNGTKLTATIIDVDTQFSGIDVTTGANGVIDVGESRKEFVGGTSDAITGLAIVNEAAPAGGATPALLTGEDTVVTIAGAFDFLNNAAVDTDEDGVVTVAEATAAAITVAGGGYALTDVAADFSSIEITTTEADETPDSATVTFESDINADTNGQLTLAKTEFSATASVGYNDAGATAGTKSVSASTSVVGEWTMNGLIAHVPFFVNDSKHSTIVTVANYTSNTPDIELIIYDGTDAIEQGVVGQAAANGVTNITAWVKAAADAAGVSSYAFDVIVNEEPENADVNAQYVNKTSGSRAVINVSEE